MKSLLIIIFVRMGNGKALKKFHVSRKCSTFAAMKEMIFTSMPMFVCLFWSVMTALSLVHEGFRRYNVRLLVFMVTAMMLYWGHCVFFNRETDLVAVSDTIYCTCNLAVYPLYLIYIASLTDRSAHRLWRILLLLPTVLGGLVVGCLYGLMSGEETLHFIETYLYGNTCSGLTGLPLLQAYVHNACKLVFALQIPYVVWAGLRRIRQFDEVLNAVYADTEQRTLHPMRIMLWLFLVTSAVSILFNAIGRALFATSIWRLAVPSVLFSALLFAIGYVGYRQRFSILDVEQDESRADSVEPEAAEHDAEPSVLRQHIEQLVEGEQLYLRPDLKLMDLVVALHSNRNYVYNAINREMGISFSDYINGLRVEHACRLMHQNHDMLMQEVAEQSGFMSNASFYRNFRRVKGCGPREYLTTLTDTTQNHGTSLEQ